MKIVACFKAVPDNDSIGINSDRTLSISGEYAAGQYDYNALEAAAQLKAKIPDSTVIALTVCSNDNGCTSKIKKAILSRGADELFAVCDPAAEGADSLYTATVLKAAVEKIGEVDLIICGEGSGDVYAQQTGTMLGTMLGWMTMNSIGGLDISENGIQAVRVLEDVTEEYEVSLPAVFSVTSDINIPRIASLKEIMAAGKKPSTTWLMGDLGVSAVAGLGLISTLAPEQCDRKRDVIKGDDADTVAKFYDKIRRVI